VFVLFSRILLSTRECAEAFKALLELIHNIVEAKPEDVAKLQGQLPAFSKEVAVAVTEVLHAAEAIKGVCVCVLCVCVVCVGMLVLSLPTKALKCPLK